LKRKRKKRGRVVARATVHEATMHPDATLDVEIVDKIPDSDDEAYARASAAAAGAPAPGEEPRLEQPSEPEPLTADSLLVILEMIYSLGVDMTARAYQVDDPELVAKLAEIGAQERALLQITARGFSRQLDKLEQFLDRWGGIAFGGVVVLGLVSRFQILKRWSEQHNPKPKPSEHADFNPDGSVPPIPTPDG
jgi:hypothetical protein